jgi:hypothetical protein
MRTFVAIVFAVVLLPLSAAAQIAPAAVLTLEQVLELAEARSVPGRRIGDEWRFSRPALIDWLAGS